MQWSVWPSIHKPAETEQHHFFCTGSASPWQHHHHFLHGWKSFHNVCQRVLFVFFVFNHLLCISAAALLAWHHLSLQSQHARMYSGQLRQRFCPQCCSTSYSISHKGVRKELLTTQTTHIYLNTKLIHTNMFNHYYPDTIFCYMFYEYWSQLCAVRETSHNCLLDMKINLFKNSE